MKLCWSVQTAGPFTRTCQWGITLRLLGTCCAYKLCTPRLLTHSSASTPPRGHCSSTPAPTTAETCALSSSSILPP
eukprot:40918-Eustigmatos_ZCMA.PRE.1